MRTTPRQTAHDSKTGKRGGRELRENADGDGPGTRRSRFALASWCLFDWANSSFSTIIVTFIFPAYFARAVAASPTEGAALWGRALAISGIAAALSAPVLGAIADRAGRRKPWLGTFTAVSVFGIERQKIVPVIEGERPAAIGAVVDSLNALPSVIHQLGTGRVPCWHRSTRYMVGNDTHGVGGEHAGLSIARSLSGLASSPHRGTRCC